MNARARQRLHGERARLPAAGTKPQTLGYGLNDSPAGLAAWIVEKFRAWSDSDGDVEKKFTKDELLTNVMIYWVTQTAVVDAHLLREPGAGGCRARVTVPTACALFPKEIVRASAWVEAQYNLPLDRDARGGHFAALEEPRCSSTTSARSSARSADRRSMTHSRAFHLVPRRCCSRHLAHDSVLAQAPAPPAVKAAMPPAAKPAWNKGIQPISQTAIRTPSSAASRAAPSRRASYDADLCKNDDYRLSLYSPYKQVAYEVWEAVRRSRSRRRRATGAPSGRGSRSVSRRPRLEKRAGRAGDEARRPDGRAGHLDVRRRGRQLHLRRPAFAPSATVTLELTGKTRTQTCVIAPAVLARFR